MGVVGESHAPESLPFIPPGVGGTEGDIECVSSCVSRSNDKLSRMLRKLTASSAPVMIGIIYQANRQPDGQEQGQV